MSKLYLHKKKEYAFKTLKDTIIIDLDKCKEGHEYEKNVFNKHPKVLKIIGKDQVDFWNYSIGFYDFPVEKVIIDTNINTYSYPFHAFYNTRYLELTNNAKSVSMINNLCLNNLKDIKIPFNINKFTNEFIKNNKVTSLTIYNDKDELTLELDECLLDREITINVLNNDNKLNINITSNNIDIEHTVYLENNKLISTKKYNKFEINVNNDKKEELNLIELKKLYNDITFTGKYYYVRKVTLNKSDIALLAQDIFNKLNLEEINIIDNNDMSLLPRNINIKVNRKNYEQFNQIEMLNNNLFISINVNSITPTKFIHINDNLNVVNLNKYIKTTILDYNANTIKYENYTLTIPFNKIINNITSSEILNEIIKRSDEVIVRKNEIIHRIKELGSLSDIVYKNEESFQVEYLFEVLWERGEVYRKCIGMYDFNSYKPTYNKYFPQVSYYNDPIPVIKKDLAKTKRPIKR